MIQMTKKERLPEALLECSFGEFCGAGEQRIQAYEDYGQAVSRMSSLLQQQYGKSFELYISEDSHDDFWEFLEQDIGSGANGIVWLARVYEHMESKAFAYQDGAYRMYPTVRNNLFVYPAWGVGLARVPVFRTHGIGLDEFIFAADDEGLQAFLEHTRKRRRTMERGQVTVFKDGPDGTEKELSSISRMVERSDVLLDATIAGEIFGAIDRFFADDKSFFEDFGIPYKRGILLYGKPGNGKTTLVKSIAGSVPAPVAYWQITEHTTSGSIEEVFRSAVAMAPMVLVVEDIDSMPQMARSYFLNTLDGAVSRDGIFLIGTTNYPENIDPALVNRAGRFDRAYEVCLPREEARREYLLRKGLLKFMSQEQLLEAARLTAGFTFAQLNELYASAVMVWHQAREVDLGALAHRMNEELEKGRSRTWLKEETRKPVGFRAM